MKQIIFEVLLKYKAEQKIVQNDTTINKSIFQQQVLLSVLKKYKVEPKVFYYTFKTYQSNPGILKNLLDSVANYANRQSITAQ